MPRTLPATTLLLLAWALSGCAGGHEARPARPEDSASIPVLLAAGDSSSARGATAEARAFYARAAAAAKRAGVRDLEFRAEMGAGQASLQLGEAETARRSLARAVELMPQSASAHVALGRLHIATHRYLDAKTELLRAAALDTLSAEPYFELGRAYAQAGDVKLAVDAFTKALARDPSHAPTQAALTSALESRYVAAGLPVGYVALRMHSTLSRGELGVLLAAELGADPERPSWRAETARPSDSEEARGAWGERWIRSAMARGWITPFADRSYHLGDPVTRGALALLLMEIEGTPQAAGNSGSPGAGIAAAPSAPNQGLDPFPDLGRRHYLARAAREATALGLPLREGGRFDPWASATGAETLKAVKGLARKLGAQPVISEELR
ncbi:MAG TPA: tetratricopeptide repeat protein [Candidatus Dormibacteraeota bacterium]|nr:tetratricopeptide repeat protein [Candidatus Dormibacteraeota bacterium]